MSKFQLDSSIKNFLDNLFKEIIRYDLVPKIQKAIRMFRREKNLLYIDKTSQGLNSVVKSQTNPKKLEYACSIKSDGSYFCGTQNLRPCGGLRGSICKHIILSFIAAIKEDENNSEEMIQWIKKTLSIRPKLEKSEATSIFIKYTHALEGKIEWRPVEIYPEDFLAF